MAEMKKVTTFAAMLLLSSCALEQENDNLELTELDGGPRDLVESYDQELLSNCKVSGLAQVSVEYAFTQHKSQGKNVFSTASWHNSQHTGPWDIDVIDAANGRPIASYENVGLDYAFAWPNDPTVVTFRRWDATPLTYKQTKIGFRCRCPVTSCTTVVF